MKKLLSLSFLALILVSCEYKLEKPKYDAQFFIRNNTSETVNIQINQIDGAASWEKSLSPDELFEVRFNIKKELKIPEGGFIFKAVFPDNQSLEKNTGYFTHYQLAGKNPQSYTITQNDIRLEE